MICHSADLPIERQALLAMFIQRTIEDETISQYKLQGVKLADALLSFIENEFDFADQESSQGPTAEAANDEDDDDIDSILVSKMQMLC